MSDEEREWTITLRGGPALLTNVTASVMLAAFDCQPGPTRECLERLARACVQAQYDDTEAKL
jgi:hypothetical protein